MSTSKADTSLPFSMSRRSFLKNVLATGTMLGIAGTGLSLSGCGSSDSGSSDSSTVKLTNVSYDPTRELYEAYNEAFRSYYMEQAGIDVEVTQSHGGSGSQARSVIEGAEADVVTLALAHDITLIEEDGLIDPGWEDEFDCDSSPYTSTIVFLVRAGNPKNLTDWDSLIEDGVEIINPNPKSSGGACWNFLAAWNWADKQYDSDETKIKEFMTKLYANVTVMDSGARGATTTFVENGQGDVLIAWENEAISSRDSYPDEFEIVSPSVSILAQPSVAVVDVNAEDDGVAEVAHDYLEYLYSDEAQEICAEHGYRPSTEEILNQYADTFDLGMDLCEISDFGGWDAAYEKFFDDGALFDEIYQEQ